MGIEDLLKSQIISTIKHLYNIDIEHALLSIQKTKKEFKGDYTLVTFPLAKITKKNPTDTAKEIGEYMLKTYPSISEFNIVNGFLNISIASVEWINVLLNINKNSKYGIELPKKDAPLYMVEYSSPNTNKPLHLGHIRNNLLGHSLSQILKANGYNVVKTNIVNDRGIHICKSMLAWQKWGNGNTPQTSNKKGDHLIGDYYVLFNTKYQEEINKLQSKGLSKKEAEEQSNLMAETREMLLKWELGDEETINLWQKMNSWVYEGFDETYKRLGISFDKIYYESQTYIIGKNTILEGLKNNLFYKNEDGSIWCDLTQYGLDHKILLRADGTSVYMTQDIGTAKIRFEDYHIDKMIYVVGNEQNYHFQVLSILLDILGFKFGKDLVHFSYGMVELPDGKMKSREGTVVDADELIDEIINTAKETSQNLGKLKDYSEEEIENISKIVGLGALKYFILKVDPKKNMVFNKEESIDFNGNTGPFIQYTHARIQSILRNVSELDTKEIEISNSIIISDKEIDIIHILSDFKSIIKQAGKEFNVSIIANYIYELSKEYNKFYHEFSILKEKNKELRHIRILISKNVGLIIKNGMELLGIDVPNKM